MKVITYVTVIFLLISSIFLSRGYSSDESIYVNLHCWNWEGYTNTITINGNLLVKSNQSLIGWTDDMPITNKVTLSEEKLDEIKSRFFEMNFFSLPSTLGSDDTPRLLRTCEFEVRLSDKYHKIRHYSLINEEDEFNKKLVKFEEELLSLTGEMLPR